MLDYPIAGGKGGEEKAHTPVETPNNLISVAYAKVLIAVAEGELAGQPTDQDIFLDGTPLANADGSRNFGGVKWEWRSGSVDQTYIQGLPEVSTEYNAGVELKFGTPWVRQITQNQLDALRVTFNWPALLEQKQNGDTKGYAIDYMIELSTDGGPFVEYQRYKVEGKTNNGYSRTHRIDLPPSSTGWTVRATKLTADSEAGTIQDTMTVQSYAEVVDAKQTYPNTALLYVEFDSRMFGGGAIPRISVRTRGRLIRVPTNYDPETRNYSGIWDGSFKSAWTDNPAWIYHDILTQDRFGLGNKVTLNMVDKYALYEIAQYCDVLVDDGTGAGKMKPRHTCNIYIQEKNDAWQVLRDLASIFNGMTYWNGNQFTAIADKQEPFNNAPIFSRSNVTNGRFDYAAADDKSIYTSALVSYDEPTNHYNTEVEATFESSQILRWGGDRQTEINAIGCTDRGEAQRRGKYTLLTNLYNRTVTFRTGLQGMNGEVMPGKLIHVVDPLIGGRPFTGRTRAAVGQVITLDRPVDGKSGDILYITRKNGVTEGRTIYAVSENIVTVQLPYTELPEANAVWYLEAADLKSQLFRVTKVSSPEESIYEIEGVEYNDSKYAAIDNGARLEPRPISVVPPGIQQPPTNVTVSSFSYVEQTLSVSTMVINWDNTPNAVGYDVQWRVDNGDWVTAGTVGVNQVNIRGIYTGSYTARVRAINPFGIKSVWSSSVITNLEGKVGLPPRITALNVSGMIFGMRLDWYFPEGATDTLRTEVRYSETASFSSSTHLGDFAYPISSHELHGLQAGKRFWFWARLHDRTGNIGPWFPYENQNGVLGQTLINDNGQYNDYFAGLISETALDKTLYDRIELIDGNGQGSVNDRLEKLQDEIGDLTDALEYKPESSYIQKDIVRLGQRLYQAKINVPAATNGSNSPPNVTYWYDIGQVVVTAEATAVQAQLNKTEITVVNGKTEANAQQISTVQVQLNDKASTSALNTLSGTVTQQGNTINAQGSAITGITTRLGTAEGNISAQSQAIQSLDTKVTQVDGKINVQTTKLDGVFAQVNPALAGDTDSYAGTDQIYVGVWSEQSARIEDGVAIGQRIDVVQANVNNNSAAIQTETLARVNGDNALATQITTVQAIAANNTAAIQQTSTTIAAVDGKVSAAWTLRMEVNSQGQYVAAGIGLGIENGPGGLQSQFLVRADRFAVVNGTTTTTTAPFVVTGGQVFISQALIGNGWITNAMIGNVIQSDNYVASSTGWRIDKSGLFEINSQDGRMRLNGSSLKFYHPNGVLGIDLSL